MTNIACFYVTYFKYSQCTGDPHNTLLGSVRNTIAATDIADTAVAEYVTFQQYVH